VLQNRHNQFLLLNSYCRIFLENIYNFGSFLDKNKE